jgi:hypothetical protein
MSYRQEQCNATTAKGYRCSKACLEGAELCRQHLKMMYGGGGDVLAPVGGRKRNVPGKKRAELAPEIDYALPPRDFPNGPLPLPESPSVPLPPIKVSPLRRLPRGAVGARAKARSRNPPKKCSWY